MECAPNGQWLPCEGWGACDDNNPLTYGDHICRPGICEGEPIPFNVAIFDSLAKIEKSQPIQSSPAGASLTAARNEFEAFQIAVRAPAGFPALTITASPLTGPGGFQIATTVYREAFISVPAPNKSSADGASGDWPDLLLPAVDEIRADPANQQAFPYPRTGTTADENIIAYVEAFVSPNAPAGTYTGSVTVNWYSTTFPVSLVVHPFTLPVTSSLQSWYRMSAPLCVPDGLSWGAKECVDLALTYAYHALDHRIAVDPTEQAQPPSSSNYVTTWETTPSDPTRSSFVAAFSGYLNGATPTWMKLQGAKPSSTGAYPNDKNPGLPTYISDWTRVYSSAAYSSPPWSAYSSPPWIGRSLYYMCDEPQGGRHCPLPVWSWVSDRAQAASGVSTSIRRLVTTAHEDASAGLGSGYWSQIDLMCPNVLSVQRRGTTDYPYEIELNYAHHRRSSMTGGKRQHWWYQACDPGGCDGSNPLDRTGYPMHAIDVPGVKNRAMPWMSFRFAMSGELYWETVAAFGRLPNTGDVSGADLSFAGIYGDGTLFYPGKRRPFPSLRLKNIRDGMEDYEYLRLMPSQQCARAIANDLFPHARSAQKLSPTSAQLLEHRRLLAEHIIDPSLACPFVPPCPANYILCNSTCVDPFVNSSNCGGCGLACSAGYACSDGACTYSPPPPPPPPSDCEPDEIDCGDRCVTPPQLCP